MKKILTIYTGPALIDPIKKLSVQLTPDFEFVHLLDDSLIGEVIKAGKMTKSVLRRIYEYCRNGKDLGVDAVFQTCSSVGVSVDLLQPFFDFPIVRIDEAMASEAVAKSDRIGVMGTLSSTLEPSGDLIKRKADFMNKEIELINGLAKGAFEALSSGDRELHDSLILKEAEHLADKCDLLVLAQGSMAGMKEKLTEVSGLPVLTSIESGLEYLGKVLEEK